MGGVGLAMILIGLLIAVLAARGTYQYLPPWATTPQSEQGISQLPPGGITTDLISQITKTLGK